MKKFLALLCTMAMVMSLFSGVVLAVNEPGKWDLEVNLTSSTVVPYVGGDPAKFSVISGTVTAGGSVPTGIVHYGLFAADPNASAKTVYDSTTLAAASPIVSGLSGNGQLNLEIGKGLITAGNTYYLVVVPTTTGAPGANDTKYSYSKSIEIKAVAYNVTVDQDLSGLTYLAKEPSFLTGKVTDSEGKGVANVKLRVVYDTTANASTATTSASGAFAVAVGQIKVGGKGQFVIEYNAGTADTPAWKTLKAFDVAAGALTMSSLVTTAKANIGTYTLSGTLKDADGTAMTTNVKATITGVRVMPVTATVDASNSTPVYNAVIPTQIDYYSKLTVNWGDTVSFLDSGVAKVVVNADNKAKGEYNVTVSAPAAVNITGLSSSYKAGTWANGADTTNGYLAGVTFTVSRYPATLGFPENVDVTITGPDFSYTKANAGAIPSSGVAVGGIYYNPTTGVVTFGMAPAQTGEVTITVHAYNKTNGTVYGHATATTKITGINVAAATKEVVVKTENVVNFTVTDKDGNAINNATVALVGTANTVTPVNGATTNINNGLYSFKDTDVATKKFNSVEKMDLQVTLPGTTPTVYTFKGFFVVKGDEVYTVESDKTSVVAGTSNSFNLTVKDVNGNFVYATKFVVTVDDVDQTPMTSLTWNSDKQFAFSGIKAFKSLKITAYTDSDTKQGSVTINVLKPQLESTKAVLTDGVTQEITIKATNPITGEPMKVNLDVQTAGLETYTTGTNPTFTDITFPTTSAASEFKFKVLADVDANHAADVVPALKFKALLEGAASSDWISDALVLKLEPASIKADLEKLIVGASNDITVTLTDANGDALAEKAIKMNGQEIGSTDEEGKIGYNVVPATTGTVVFSYTNNAGEDVKVSVPVVRDTIVPVVTMGEVAGTVKTNSVTITGVVNDNVSVSRIFVNNREVVGFPNIDGDLEFETEIELKLGANVIRVVALDAAGNRGTAEVTVTRELPTVVKLALGSADATINGQAAAGVAPYLKGNSTMVPFRFIGEALGAYVEWNEAAQTVTLSLDGTTVILTIGSTTAMVNGEAKTMPVAPEITNGRTMVPLRFVGEALGAYVEYNPANGGITVTR